MSHDGPAILFDLDGTLVDTLGHWVDAYLATLADYGARALTREVFFREVYARNLRLEDVLDELGVPPALEPAFRARRDERYVEYLEARVAWMREAEAVVRRLARDHALGLVTAAWTHYVDAMDRRLGLREHFLTIVTADDLGAQGKPDPYGLLLAASALGVDAAACLYVGDQPHDMEAARRAGMTAVLVPHENTAPGARERADRVIPTLGGLVDDLRLR